MPSSAASSSPRQQRPRRAVAAPVEGGGEHLAGELEVGLDRLLGGEGAAAASGEAVGDGEQGDVRGHRLGRPQVLVDAARRQRHLVDEEAEAQVVQGQRLQMRGQRAARPQPAAGGADHLGALAVVADEGDVAAALAAGRRLADVVEDRAEAQRRAPGHLVGERLVEQRPGLRGALAGEAIEVRLDLERALQHRQRVAVDVEVVVGPLLDAAQVGELGQDDRGEAELVEQGEAAQRVGAADQLAQLDQLPLPRRLAGAPGLGPGQRRRSPGRSPARARRRAAPRAAAAAGRRRSCPRRPTRRRRRSRSARPPWGSIGSPPASGTATAPTVKSRSARSASIVSPRSAVDVDLPGPVAVDDAPGRELGRELEGVPPARRGDRLRRRLGAAGDREVEVGHLAAEGRVADGAPDDPGVDPGSPGPRGRARPPAPPRVAPRAHGMPRAHALSRGTRAEIPQVTS